MLLRWKTGKILEEKMRLALPLITGAATLRLKSNLAPLRRISCDCL